MLRPHDDLTAELLLPKPREATMEARTRFDRAAAAILAVVGVFAVGRIAMAAVDALPAITSDNPHQRDDALFGLLLIGIPIAVGGLLTLLLAWRLWHAQPSARGLALVWVVVAGLASAVTFSFGTILWAVRVMVLYPNAVSVGWPYLYYNPFYESPAPYGSPVIGGDQLAVRLDTVDFWLPGIVVVGVLAVAGLLVASWITGRARRARIG
jgi:hypothetical protein